MAHLEYFIILAFIAEVLGTIGGFGSSLFFIPIAAYFLDFHSVLGITALFHVSSNISKIFLFKSGFETKIILSIGIPAVLFVIMGAFLSKLFDSYLLEICLSLFLIVLSSIFLIFKKLEIKPTLPNSIGTGVLSGFLAGLLGTGGAIRGLSLVAFNLKTEVFIATSAIIDLGVDASRSVVYFFNGYMDFKDLYLVPILLIVSISGTFCGKWLLKFISESQFKTIVLLLVMATGVSSLVKILFFQ
ncbi:MAG: sulfite exporter TauE/SafE family protein [Bacteroidota bacterium]|nr:sulfite exporter TauE/SafE family protein [Bacteroidota bacterium]